MEISASPFTAISGLNTYRDQIGRLAQGDARVDQIGRPAQGYQASVTGVVTGITQWPFEATQELSVFG